MKSERGEMNIGGMIMLSIGMIFIAVGIIIFPVITGTINTSVLLPGPTSNLTAFVGVSSIIKVVPLLVLVGFMAGGVLLGFFGVKSLSS